MGILHTIFFCTQGASLYPSSATSSPCLLGSQLPHLQNERFGPDYLMSLLWLKTLLGSLRQVCNEILSRCPTRLRKRKSVQNASCGRRPATWQLPKPAPARVLTPGSHPERRTKLAPLRWFTAQISQRPKSRTAWTTCHKGALCWESGDGGSRPTSY